MTSVSQRRLARAGNRMTTRRKVMLALGAGAIAAPLAAFALPPPAKVARIGFMGQVPASSLTSRVDPLRTGLVELGYVEGKNIVIEVRGAETIEKLLEVRPNWFVSRSMSS